MQTDRTLSGDVQLDPPAWNDGTSVLIRGLKAMRVFHKLWAASSQMTRGMVRGFGKGQGG